MPISLIYNVGVNLYKNVFQALKKAKVNYLIIGGIAVNLYGYSRFTGDMDILLALDVPNLKKMERIMEKLGYVQRLPINVTDLGDKKKVKKWIKEKGMTAYTFISAKHPQLNIDIVVDQSLNFSRFMKKRTMMEIWGIKVPVISLNDLMAMKKKANRDKDLDDLKNLLELKTL